MKMLIKIYRKLCQCIDHLVDRNKNMMNIIEITIDAENIRSKFEQNEQLFGELRGQVISCARKIKIFKIISEYKQNHSELKGEFFWGWLQIETLCPEIIVACHKLSSDIPKFITMFLKLVVPEHLISTLKKESNLMRSVKELKKDTENFEQYRNKRGAHVDCVLIDPVTVHMEPLYKRLSCIDSSLTYIAHFLLNPRLIIDKNWRAYNLDKQLDLDSLDIYFEHDYSVNDCENLLSMLHSASEKEMLNS